MQGGMCNGAGKSSFLLAKIANLFLYSAISNGELHQMYLITVEA
jgi:hypothetical protein